MKPVVLLVLDGWGIGEKSQGNPISQVPTPTFDWMKKNFPSLALQASGINVGLPWGQAGNSEAGHLAMGAGRILYQHYPRITMAIRDGSFYKNPAFLDAFRYAKTRQAKVHFVGTLSSSNVHASFGHLDALLELAKNAGVDPLLHLFTDGRDSPPRDAKKNVERVASMLEKIGVGKIASLAGRFYAMDRDDNWERTEKAFRLLVENGKIKKSTSEILDETYELDLTDEFVEPTLIGAPEDAGRLTVGENDSLIFFNFREDCMAQLARAFADPALDKFPRPNLASIFVVTMTQYAEGLNAKVAFPKEYITHPLGWVLSRQEKRQLRLTESERASHVTFFFNGLRAEPFPNEYWVVIPSPRVFRLEEVPELSSAEVLERLLQSMEERVYDFILVNFPNADLIAHTGNFDAALKVVKIMDRVVNKISSEALKLKIPLIVTSDHGNIENMLHPLTGRVDTVHDEGPVPFYLIDKRFFRARSDNEIAQSEKEISGGLVDVAPTVLEIMGLEKPDTMTGQSLIPLLK